MIIWRVFVFFHCIMADLHAIQLDRRTKSKPGLLFAVPVIVSTPLTTRQCPTNVAAAPSEEGCRTNADTGPPLPNKSSISPVQSEPMVRRSDIPATPVAAVSNAVSIREDSHSPSTDEHGVSSGPALSAMATDPDSFEDLDSFEGPGSFAGPDSSGQSSPSTAASSCTGRPAVGPQNASAAANSTVIV